MITPPLPPPQALTLAYIQSTQIDNGAIPWFKDGKLDPWDHTEAMMGLSIGGDFTGARKAFQWLAEEQLSNGAWYAEYFADNEPGKIETNFVAYPATGLWHYFLISNDTPFIQQYFPVVEKAIEYVLTLQSAEGDICWATSTQASLPNDALITACASILRSLECAIQIAKQVSHTPTRILAWIEAYRKLAFALKHKPQRFDRTWEPKTRFSMDWFYPLLTGIYTPAEAQARLHTRREVFVNEALGCRCVSDEPWVTVAESCEFIMSLVAAGKNQEAKNFLAKLHRWQDADGGYWTGYNFRDDAIWPEEKTTWTAGATLLAYDAIYQHSPASGLFTQPSHLWPNNV